MPSEDLEIRKDRARLRALMYEPQSVMLQQDKLKRWWLTDMYVMLEVSGAPSVEGVPPGEYKLLASGEMRELSTRIMDIDGWRHNITNNCRWAPASPTMWSVAEHPGKAMLFRVEMQQYCDKPYALLGEPTWTAFQRHHGEGLEVMYSTVHNLFRFSVRDWWSYAAGIRCPGGQEDVAKAIALASDSTSKYDESTSKEA